MTDGAAKTLLHHGDQDLVDRALPRLTSRDPDTFWTSGQWMTERTGGSDVGLSETTAIKDGATWRLHGTKWFTSAITSQMALTLARPEDNGPGGSGLAMYYLEVRDEAGDLNNIRVLRLKDKLGTRQMPTAELALDGTVAHLVGEPAHGTRNITPMLTITRLWNSVMAASGLRRAVALTTDYARRREAFGRLLVDQPLHQATMAQLRVRHAAATAMSLRLAELLGREETGVITAEEARALRLMLPVTKLLTGKQAVAGASEGLEALAGPATSRTPACPCCCVTPRCCRSGRARPTCCRWTRCVPSNARTPCPATSPRSVATPRPPRMPAWHTSASRRSPRATTPPPGCSRPWPAPGSRPCSTAPVGGP